MIRKLDRSEWREKICDDLWPVLDHLEERHGIVISEVIFDLKGAYTDVYVGDVLTPEIIEEVSGQQSLRVCDLRTGDAWISCPQHYGSIQSITKVSGAAPHRTVMDPLKGFFE
jgi:hypothetical protein